jgi:hypothetical protein
MIKAGVEAFNLIENRRVTWVVRRSAKKSSGQDIESCPLDLHYALRQLPAPTTVLAIAFRIASAESRAVGTIAVPKMLRVIRIEGAAIAHILLTAIQPVTKASLLIIRRATVIAIAATIVAAAVWIDSRCRIDSRIDSRSHINIAVSLALTQRPLTLAFRLLPPRPIAVVATIPIPILTATVIPITPLTVAVSILSLRRSA